MSHMHNRHPTADITITMIFVKLTTARVDRRLAATGILDDRHV